MRQNMISDKGGGVLADFWVFSDNGERGVGTFFFWLTRGVGVWTHPLLADIIYEQPLTVHGNFYG